MSTQSPVTAVDSVAQDLRLQIIQAAQRCRDRRGWRSTTISSIAHEAGMPKRTLYKYFPNRDSIINAVLQEDARIGASVLEVLIDEVSARGGDPVLALQELMLDLLEDPARFDVWRTNIEWWAEAGRNADILKGFQETWRAWRETIDSVVQRSLGEQAPGTTRAISQHMLAVFNGMLLHGTLDREGLDFAEQRRFLRDGWQRLKASATTTGTDGKEDGR